MNCLLETSSSLRSPYFMWSDKFFYSGRIFYSSKSSHALYVVGCIQVGRDFFWQRQTMKQKNLPSKVDLTKCLPKKKKQIWCDGLFRAWAKSSFTFRWQFTRNAFKLMKNCEKQIPTCFLMEHGKNFAIILMASKHHVKVSLRKKMENILGLSWDDFFCENMDKWE